MSTWSESCAGYKLGTVGIILSFIAFAVAFSTPAWIVNIYQLGVWLFCTADWTCVTIGQTTTAHWVFRGLEIGALISFLSAAINIIFKDCCCPYSGPGRIVAPACIGGVLGLVAAVILITWVSAFDLVKDHLSWSFGLSVGACVLGILCAILVGCTGTNPGTPGQRLDGSAPEQNMNEMPGYGKPYQPYQQPQAQPYHQPQAQPYQPYQHPSQQSNAFANQQYNNYPQRY